MANCASVGKVIFMANYFLALFLFQIKTFPHQQIWTSVYNSWRLSIAY